MTNTKADCARQYLDALHALAPLIAAQRNAFDRERRLPGDVFEALADAGLFRLWLPRALGGPELSPLAFMAVVEAASALDGSVGWLVGNGGGMSRVGGYLAPAVAGDVFAPPRGFVTSATGAIGAAIPVDGGYRVSGRWPFGSGAPHATHFMVLATSDGGTAPDRPRICCYVPRARVAIHDTWHASGLRATGSCDFELRDAFVPSDHAHPFLDHVPAQPGLLYRMPPLAAFAWTVTVVPLGIARGAIDAFARLADRPARLRMGGQLRDREAAQATIGRAEVLHRAARGLLVDAMTDLMAAIETGGDPLVAARIRLRAAGAHAAESAIRIVDSLEAEAGAAAIFESCPLERAVRDVHAAVKHVAMNPSIYAVVGRVDFSGLDPGAVRF